jgi:tyrosinase
MILMAQFDISQSVHNILSSGGGTGPKVLGTVIRTATDMANVPGVEVANLASLPGVGAALGAALGLAQGALGVAEGALGGLIPGARTRQPPRQAPESRRIQKREFNPFNLTDVRAAAVMASKLIEIADRKGGDAGLADAIGAVASFGEALGEVGGLAGDLASEVTRGLAGLAGEVVNEVVNQVGAYALGLTGLRQHALTLFVTHYPTAHQQITLQPFDVREPNLVSRFGSLVTTMDPSGSKEIPSDENKVSFWREDAQLNDHHGRWHAVYPPTPVAPVKLGDRNGELFAYMHMQMLARYDAERFSVGLERVKEFTEYKVPIPEGYTPGERVMASGDGKNWTKYKPRPANAMLGDIPADSSGPAAPLQAMIDLLPVLINAAEKGFYAKIKDNPPISLDNFGNTIEASAGSVDAPDRKNYGNYHADGHVHFALFDGDQSTPKTGIGPIGVMLNLSATSRDPIFWRWHKHVDTIIQKCRLTVGKKDPHDFTRGPKVTVRNEDIIVVRGTEGLPVDVDGGELGAKAFGYSENATENRWDTDFSSGPATVTLAAGKAITVTTTNELWTEMRTRTIHPIDPHQDPVDPQKTLSENIEYLSHEDFSYFIRLQNDSEASQQVTIRMFLTPEEWVEKNDNTTWIEMDRFLYSLAGRERAVVCRPARLSAVVRKPAIGHEELEGTKPRPPATSWCDCGWPYTLLLPRGTKEGLDFRLLVVLTSNDLTMDDTGQKCTSMSYCGLQDEKYPDSLPMGYPFDQPLTENISSIINKHENWASRKIRIRCRNI